MISVRELEWAAGFLEGEGCFTFAKGTPLVTVFQKQKEPLERLGKLFKGGSFSWVEGKQGWVRSVNGKRAAGVMMTLYCLMSPKRQEQILKALEFWKAMPKFTERGIKGFHICKRGHDMSIVGKTSRNTCKQCKTNGYAKSYQMEQI